MKKVIQTKLKMTILAVMIFFAAGVSKDVFAGSIPPSEKGTILHEGKSGDMSWQIDDKGTLFVEGNGQFAGNGGGGFFIDKYGNEYFLEGLDLGYKKYADDIISARICISGCKSLSSLLSDLPNLKTVDFTGSDTSKVEIFTCLFCADFGVDSSLEYLDLRNLDTSSGIEFTQMFKGCNKLKEVDLRGWDTSNATSFHEMFNFCHSLETIRGIEDLDTSNVYCTGIMFQQDYMLRQLDLSKWNTVNLWDIHGMFQGCGNYGPFSCKMKILLNSVYYLDDDAAFNGLWDEGCSVELSYVDGTSSREQLEHIAETAGDNSYKITISEITEPDGHHFREFIFREPACETAGIKRQQCSICGRFIDEEIPALGHDWEEPEYEWFVELTNVTAVRYCRKNKNHRETEFVLTKAAITKAPTYTEKGQTTYTAVFTNPGFKTQTKTLTNINKLEKLDNPLKLNGKTVKLKYSVLKKKPITIKCSKAIVAKNVVNKLNYKLIGVTKSKYKKYFIVNSDNGSIIAKRGLKKGSYKIKIRVTSAGNNTYKTTSKKVTTIIKVK